MKTKTFLAISASLVITMTSGLYAQMPAVPQVDKSAAQQAQQNANQVKQNTAQQTQQASQNAAKLQQNAKTTTSSASSYAQQAEKEVAKIAAKVKDLTPDQKAKLKQTFVDYFTKRAQNKVAAGTDQNKLKQLNATVNKAQSDGIKSILTPAQLAEWKKPAPAKVAPAAK